MTLHIDLVTALDERAIEASARRLESELTRMGHVSGEAFNKALTEEASRSHLAADEIGNAMRTRLSEHGRGSGEGFLDSFHSHVSERAHEVGSEIGTHIKTGILGALGAGEIASAVGAIGYTFVAGFEKLEALDRARIKMETLGQTGEQIKATMDSVSEAVKGTAFSMGSALDVATKALSSGVRPDQLTQYVKDVEDFAAFTHQSLDDAGSVFTKVAAGGAEGGQLMARQLLSLKAEGIPALRELAAEYGVTEAQMTTMIKSGQVGLPQLEHIVETTMSGIAGKMAHTVGGEIDQLKNNFATLGATFITALSGDAEDPTKGVADSLQKVNDKVTELSAWVSSHAAEIHQFWEETKTAVGELVTVLRDVLGAIDDIPGGITTVVGAFAAWETISGVIALKTKLAEISTMLRVTLPADAEAAGVGIGAALSRVAIPVWLSAYLGNKIANEIQPPPAGEDRPWYWPIQQGLEAPGKIWHGITHGGDIGSGDQPKPSGPPTNDFWGGLAPPGSSPSSDFWGREAPPGAAGGPPPLLPPSAESGKLPKAPEIPFPAEYGQPPQPGESAEHYRGRMEVIQQQHSVAEARARVDQLEHDNTATQDDIVKARNTLVQAQLSETESEQRLNAQKAQAVQVPYPTGYGAPPRPGESSEQYGKEQSYYDAVHRRAEAEARLAQVQSESTHTAEDLVKANNELTKARGEEYQAQLRLHEGTKKLAGTVNEFGAKLDQDLGISKGLAGIAENVVKFLGNLALAPLMGQLGALSNAPGQAQGGFGLLGIAAAQGAFGPQYTAEGQAAAAASTAGTTATYTTAAPGAATGMPYGLPAGTNTGGYGSSGPVFPDWVHQLESIFGVKASTYPGHQESDRNEPGYAPNPLHLNRGIDWSGSAENMERFAAYVATLPQAEQVIYSGQQPYEYVAGQQRPGYFAGDLPAHTGHVHTRQSTALPVPGGAIPDGTAVPATAGYGASSSANFGGGSFPIPLPVTIVGGAGLGANGAPIGSPASGQGSGAAPGPAPVSGGGGQSWLAQQLASAGLSPDETRGILAMNQVEGGATNPSSLLGFTDSQAQGPQAHVDAFLKQWNDTSRRGAGGSIPGVGAGGQVADWNAYMNWIREKIVGQTGAPSDWQGNAQPSASDYQSRLMQALGQQPGSAPNAPPAPPAAPAPHQPYSGNPADVGATGQVGEWYDKTTGTWKPASAPRGGQGFPLPLQPANPFGSPGLPNVTGTETINNPSGLVLGAPIAQGPQGISQGLPDVTGTETVNNPSGTVLGAPLAQGPQSSPPAFIGSSLAPQPPAGSSPFGGPAGAGGMAGAGIGTPGAPSGPGAGPSPIGGGAGLSGTGKGGIGMSEGGTLDTAMGLAASAVPGLGQAAQTGMKLANRAIQYGGQVAGILTQGAVDTWLPFGGSELASHNWLTRIVGGLAGAAPALPNMAGKSSSQKTPEQAAGSAASGQGQGPPPGPPPINVEYHNHQATEDRAGADLTNHLGSMYQGAMR